MKSQSTIIIIDDQVQDEELLIVIKENYADVIVYNSSTEAIKNLSRHYGHRIIILLDLSFPTNQINGHQVLERIRESNTLIPVIIFSAVNENESGFSDLINNSAFGFLKRDASLKQILDMLQKAEFFLKTSIGGALEEWIKTHSEEELDRPYLVSVDGNNFTLKELLSEVRLQTEVGQSFSKSLSKLTIDLLARGRENLND